MSAVVVVALLVVGCVRKWPVYYAPVWSADGAKLYYVTARPEGGLAIREVDVASRQGAVLTIGRLTSPPSAIALSPQRDKAACAVVVREKGRAPLVRIHILSPAGNGDRVAWETPCVQGVVDLCWMPDGRSLLVAADRPGGSGLFRVPATGGTAQTVAAGLCEVRDPAASPDGRRVVFVGREKPGEPWSLYVASTDGASRKVAVPALFREHQVGYGPAWSPRGDVVAYVAERYLCPGRTEILLWDPATGGSRLLGRTLAGGCIAPAWSPRGDSIAFVSLPLGVGPGGPGTGGLPADILVMDTAGKGTLTVTADGLANLMPSWSPDGRFLAFGTCGEPGSEPHVVQVASVETGKVGLAEDGPEAELLLALARHRRSGVPAAAALASLASRMTDQGMLAFAAPVLAGLFADVGDWAKAAVWARRATGGPDADTQARGLRLLARAQMRLGEAKGALATAELLVSKSAGTEEKGLRDALRQGIETAARLEAELKATRSPVLLQALADTYLRQLGNPRKALDLLLGLAKEFPEGTHLRPAGESVFACAEQLDALRIGNRVLEWAAEQVGGAGSHLHFAHGGEVPNEDVTPVQRLVLAGAAVAHGDARAALRWLDGLAVGAAPEGLRERAAQAWLGAAGLLATSDAPQEALAAYRKAMAHNPKGVAAARAAVEASKLVARDGGHWEATRLLLHALTSQAPAGVRREALRLLTVGRLQRRDPLAYDVAEAAQLAAFGFLEAAIAQGERLRHAVALNPDGRATLRRALAEAFEGLAAYHLARGDVAAARQVLGRWLATTSRTDDLPRALARLAECHRQAGEERSLVEVLSHLAAEFPDRPEGAQARRELLLLDTRRQPSQ